MSGHARLRAAGGWHVRRRGGRREGEQWKAEEGVDWADEPSSTTEQKWVGQEEGVAHS